MSQKTADYLIYTYNCHFCLINKEIKKRLFNDNLKGRYNFSVWVVDYSNWLRQLRDACQRIVIIGNEHGDQSSYPGQGCLHFT